MADIKTIALTFGCVLMFVVIIALVININLTVKNHGHQLQLLISRQKEGFPVVPGTLYQYASEYNNLPNNLITTQQNAEWHKDAQPPIYLNNNDRAMTPFWAIPTPNKDTPPSGATDDKGANDAPIKLEDTAGNPISTQTNTNVDLSQAETSVLDVTPEDATKAGAGAMDGLGYDNKLVPETQGPVPVQTGVVDQSKENFGLYSMNMRAGDVLKGKYMVHKGWSKRNNSLFGKEGFKPRLNAV